jgi:hypothetical protein
MTAKPTITLTLVDNGGSAPLVNRVRSALKTLLRAFGLRCVSVKWDDQEHEPEEPPA